LATKQYHKKGILFHYFMILVKSILAIAKRFRSSLCE